MSAEELSRLYELLLRFREACLDPESLDAAAVNITLRAIFEERAEVHRELGPKP